MIAKSSYGNHPSGVAVVGVPQLASDPRASHVSTRDPSASSRVAPSRGGQATGGAEALWSGGPLRELAAYGSRASAGRVDADVGYGLPVGSRFVGTPRVGFGSSEYGRDYRLGYGLGVLERAELDFELGVDAQRPESPMLGGTNHGGVGEP